MKRSRSTSIFSETKRTETFKTLNMLSFECGQNMQGMEHRPSVYHH